MKQQTNTKSGTTAFLSNADDNFKTRLLGILGFLLSLTILVMELTGNLTSGKWKIVSDFIIVPLFIILIIKPNQLYLLSIISVLAAFMNLFYGGHVLGLLFYAFGMAIALKQGFFRTGKKLKVPFMFIIFFIFMLLQLRIKTSKFIISMVNILIAMAIIFAFLYLFQENLKGYYTSKPVMDLSVYGFTPRQLACVHGCIQKKKLKEIADEQIISESAIKREMLEIYRVFKVEDRHELYRMLSEYTII